MRFLWCLVLLGSCVPNETRVPASSPPSAQDTVVASNLSSSSTSDSATPLSSANAAAPERVGVPADTGVTASLVASLEVETEAESHTEGWVEVRMGLRADTIPGIVAAKPPGVSSDGIVYGVTISKDGSLGKGFRYDPKTRQLSFLPLPKDVGGWDSEISISPDARHLAYLGGDSSGHYGIVRDWPSMTLMARTPSAPGYPSDYNSDQVRWRDANRFELFFRFPAGVDTTNNTMISKFIVARGDVRTRSMSIDTTAKIPEWTP